MATYINYYILLRCTHIKMRLSCAYISGFVYSCSPPGQMRLNASVFDCSSCSWTRWNQTTINRRWMSFLLPLVVCCVAEPTFTNHLKIILRQFLDLRQSYDNWRILRTFTTILRPVLRHNLTITF